MISSGMVVEVKPCASKIEVVHPLPEQASISRARRSSALSAQFDEDMVASYCRHDTIATRRRGVGSQQRYARVRAHLSDLSKFRPDEFIDRDRLSAMRRSNSQADN